MQITLLLLCFLPFLYCHGNLLSVDKTTGEVYWAIENQITRMSANLTVLEVAATGPEPYHADCQHPHEPCEFERVPTDFVPLVISVTHRRSGVILCGTLYNGRCQLRFKNSLSTRIWIGPFNTSNGLTVSGPSRLLPYGGLAYFAVSSYIPGPGPKSAFASIKVLRFSGSKSTGEMMSPFTKGITNMYFTDEKERTVIHAEEVGASSGNGSIFYILFTEDNARTKLLRLTVARSIESVTEMEVSCRRPGEISQVASSATIAWMEENLIYEFFVIFKESESHPSDICVHMSVGLNLEFKQATDACNKEEYRPDPSIIFTGDYNQNTTETIRYCRFQDKPLLFYPESFKDFRAAEWSEISTFHMYYNYKLEKLSRWILYDIEGKGVYRASEKDKYNKLIDGQTFRKPSTALNSANDTVYFSDEKVVSRYTIGTCGFYMICDNCTVDPLCSWCHDSCKPKTWCAMNTDLCSPNITKVTPETLSFFGSHRISIEGAQFTNRKGTITISSNDCFVNRWEDSLVECSLWISNTMDRGSVELKTPDGKFARSKEVIAFLIPVIYGVYPVKGPVSGGTNVTIFGEKLNLSNITELIVGERHCTLTRVTEKTLSCTTNSGRNYDQGMVRVTMDGFSIPFASYKFEELGFVVSDFFKFTSDPEIFSIHPSKRTVRGDTHVTIFGSNLNVVLAPRMLVLAPSQLRRIIEIEMPCFPSSDGKTMTCSTPDLLERSRDFFLSQPLVCHLAFIMDGVMALRDLPRLREKLSRFVYYPEPEYDLFDHPLYVGLGVDEVVLKGRYLNVVYDVNATKVIVGKTDTCRVISVGETNLTCKMSQDFLSNTSLFGRKLSIQVFTDTYQQTVGNLILTATNARQIDPQLTALFSCLGAVIILVMAVWLFTRYRGNFKNPKKVLQKQDESQVLMLKNLEIQGLLVKREHLKIGNILAQGQFGQVHEGVFDFNNENLLKVALKTTKHDCPLHSERWSELMSEAVLMKDFRHINVLHLIGISYDDGKPLLVLPFMDHGDLHSYIKDPEHVLTIGDLLKFSYHIASGMAYISSGNYVHRDLAARNCMLTGKNRDQWIVKVADFGLSRSVRDSQLYQCQDQETKSLPYKWMAPECIRKATYSEQTDVWSYGVVVWELMTRAVIPYASVDVDRLLDFLEEGKRLPRPEYCGEKLDNLMLRCWQYHSAQRPLFRDVEPEIRQIWEECSLDPGQYNWLTKAQNTSTFDRD